MFTLYYEPFKFNSRGDVAKRTIYMETAAKMMNEKVKHPRRHFIGFYTPVESQPLPVDTQIDLLA